MASSNQGDEIRRVFLPYCIRPVEGMGHVVLNRHYQPLGMPGTAAADYVEHAVKIHGLTAAVVRKLSIHADSDPGRPIYLYDDGSIPTAGPQNWKAYQERLRVLAGLEVG